jgi:hypothetical protein
MIESDLREFPQGLHDSCTMEKETSDAQAGGAGPEEGQRPSNVAAKVTLHS